MKYLTLEEIISEAQKRKIDLGNNPEKTILTFTSLGLLPKPTKKPSKKNEDGYELYYPAHTVDKLGYIKALKSEGASLDEIRDSFALLYVQNALRDLLASSDDVKIKQLAEIIAGKGNELESIVAAPLIYLIEGMSDDEAKNLLGLFFGVGFYAMLDAQKELENYNINEAKRALFKAIFYNSIAVLRLARDTGDKKLEKTASNVYEKIVLEPLNKASEIVRNEFIKSIGGYIEQKEDKKKKRFKPDT